MFIVFLSFHDCNVTVACSNKHTNVPLGYNHAIETPVQKLNVLNFGRYWQIASKRF